MTIDTKKLGKLLIYSLVFLMMLSCASCAPASPDETADETPPEQRSALEILADIHGVTEVEQVRVTNYDSIDWSVLPDEMLESMREMVDGIVKDTLSYSIIYEIGTVKIQAFCSVPADYLESKRPLVISLRGGNGEYGAINQGDTAAESYLSGCIILSTQYRGTPPGTGMDEFGGADLQDVLFWIEHAKELTFADTERIYIIGVSRGGMELCMALRDAPKGIINAAASISGIYNLTQTYTEREDMRDMLVRRIGGTPDTVPEAYEERSAVAFADLIDTPLLIVHSTGDTRVSYSQAQIFASVLKSEGKEYEFWTRDDDGHGINSAEEMKSIIEWLELHK